MFTKQHPILIRKPDTKSNIRAALGAKVVPKAIDSRQQVARPEQVGGDDAREVAKTDFFETLRGGVVVKQVRQECRGGKYRLFFGMIIPRFYASIHLLFFSEHRL